MQRSRKSFCFWIEIRGCVRRTASRQERETWKKKLTANKDQSSNSYYWMKVHKDVQSYDHSNNINQVFRLKWHSVRFLFFRNRNPAPDRYSRPRPGIKKCECFFTQEFYDMRSMSTYRSIIVFAINVFIFDLDVGRFRFFHFHFIFFKFSLGSM